MMSRRLCFVYVGKAKYLKQALATLRMRGLSTSRRGDGYGDSSHPGIQPA